MGAIGDLRYQVAGREVRAHTRTLAPELRTGIALGDRRKLLGHGYLSASVGWMRVDDGRGKGDHLAWRLAAGLSIPAYRRITPQLAGEMITAEAPGYQDPDGSRAGTGLYRALSLPVAFMLFILPDTIEITWERVDGREFTGVAWGYSL